MSSCLIFSSGCLNEFPLKKEADSTGDTDSSTATLADTDSLPEDDTGTETDMATDSDSPTDTGTLDCDVGMEFDPAIQFTELALTDRPALEYVDSCPAGQVVIGFQGYLRPPGQDDLAHGQIQAVCGIPEVTTVGGKCVININEGDTTPMRGTSGSIEWTGMCPENNIIIGFKTWAGHNIYQFVFRCAPLIFSAQDSEYTLTWGIHSELEAIGSSKGPFFFEQICGENQVATGLKVNADSLLRGLALGCQSPSAPH